jgi:hypothetical protein
MIRLNRFPGGVYLALTMSYDDGHRADRRLVEIFDKYGIRGTFHLISGQLGMNHAVTEEDVSTLYRNHEVSCHTVHHPNMTQMPVSEQLNEIMADRKKLEALCGYPVRGMSYPYGAYSAELIKNLRTVGMEYSRTVRSTESFDLPEDFMAWHPTTHHNNPKLNELFDRFCDNSRFNTQRVMYVWGHSFEFDRDDNWGMIEDFCKKAGGREDIWYATNIEIFDYVTAQRALRFSADMHSVYNPSAADVWFEADGRPVKVGGGETINF